MKDIDAIERGGTGTGDSMNDIVKNSIDQIKVLALLFLFFQFYTQDYPRKRIPPWVIAIGTSVAAMNFLVYSTQYSTQPAQF